MSKKGKLLDYANNKKIVTLRLAVDNGPHQNRFA